MSRARAALVLLVVLLAGCGGSGRLSASDQQFAENVLEADVTASDSMGFEDACSDAACLRLFGREAVTKLGAEIARIENGLPAVRDDCLHRAGGSFLVALRVQELAARRAALGEKPRMLGQETQARSLRSHLLNGFAECPPTRAGALALAQAMNAIANWKDRVDRCATDACLSTEGARLGPILDEQRRSLDAAFEHETACVRTARAKLDNGLDAAKRSAEAVARHNRAAARAAMLDSDGDVDQGVTLIRACLR